MCLPIDRWLCMPHTVDDDPAPARTQHVQRNGGHHHSGNGGSHYNGNGGHHHSGNGGSHHSGNGGSHHNGNGGHHHSGNGGHHHNGNGYPAHSRAAAEAARKAANDVRRGPAHHATGAQERAAYGYAGADETSLRQQQPHAAWNGRVAAADGHGARGGPPHSYSPSERAQLPPHREDAVDSHYTATTATADHESTSEALGGE